MPPRELDGGRVEALWIEQYRKFVTGLPQRTRHHLAAHHRRMPRSALGPALKRAGARVPAAGLEAGHRDLRLLLGVSQMVTLTMRFCLPPTMVSPPKMTTGWPGLDRTVGTAAAELVDIDARPGRLVQGQICRAGRIRGRAEAMTTRPSPPS